MIVENRILEFEKLGLGIFIHFGAYSKYEYGEWASETLRMDRAKYEEEALKDDYTCFDAKNMVNSAKIAGAKYITLTTRHHDGFSLFDTRGLSDFSVMRTVNGRDLIAEFCDECRKADIVPFLYHTTLDWNNPDFENDFPKYLEYLQSSVEILCTHYGKIGGLWFDGNWAKPNDDWKLDELYASIRNLQPDAMIINNTGLHDQGGAGHIEIDAVTYEQGSPSPIDFEKIGKYMGGEVCLPLNEHWGVAHDINYKSMRQIVESTAICRKFRANMLLGIGLNFDSTVPPIQHYMVAELGKWIEINKVPFFEGKPCAIKTEGKNYALITDNGEVYLFVFGITTMGDENVMLDVIKKDNVFEGISKQVKSAYWLDTKEEINFEQDLEKEAFTIKATQFTYGTSYIVRVAKLEF